jgi:glycosyltransferase involved in cell wall biosynthesis
MIRFSVALPVRNGADYIGEALDSILAQDHEALEVVVSDNASTDATPDILGEYARRDARVKVSRLRETIPQAANVNRALELANEPWVKLFCHDDVMHPQCLSTLASELTRPGIEQVGLIGHGEEWLFANGFRYGRFAGERAGATQRQSGPELVRAMLNGGAALELPALSNALVRREAWRRAGGFDPRYVHFDVFFWMRLLLRWDYVYLPQVLITYRIHGAQVAVSARKSLSSVDDHRRFWSEFVEEVGPELGLGWRARTRAQLRGLSTAGSYVGVELVKRRFADAVRLAASLPPLWWPVLPLVAARSMLMERRRIRPYRESVPLSLIYP